MGYRLRDEAKADLRAVVAYLDSVNPTASRRWALRLRARLRLIGQSPGIGAPRPDVRPDLRLWVVGSYVILYLHRGRDAEVLRVLHAARDWESMVEPPDP